MKNFRLAIRLIIVLFLLGKAATTVFDLKINGLEVIMEAATEDSSEEPSAEDDPLEGDDEVVNGIHSFQILLTAEFDSTFYFRTPLESQQDIIVPPPQV